MKKEKINYFLFVNFVTIILFFTSVSIITEVEPLANPETKPLPLTIDKVELIARKRIAESLGISINDLQLLLEFIKKKLFAERFAYSIGISIDELKTISEFKYPKIEEISVIVNRANEKYKNGWTMLMHIARGELLCKGYAKIIYEECSNENYINTIQNIYKTIMQVLIDAKIDINQKNNEKQSALMIAFHQKNKPFIELLSKHNINFNEQDETGRSLLHHAIELGYHDIACTWIKRGAPLDVTTKDDGWDNLKETPLMFAAQRNSLQVVECLISAGANPLLRNMLGKTATAIATQDNIKYLLEKAIQDEKEKQLLQRKILKIQAEKEEKRRREIIFMEKQRKEAKEREEKKWQKLEKERIEKEKAKQAIQKMREIQEAQAIQEAIQEAQEAQEERKKTEKIKEIQKKPPVQEHKEEPQESLKKTEKIEMEKAEKETFPISAPSLINQEKEKIITKKILEIQAAKKGKTRKEKMIFKKKEQKTREIEEREWQELEENRAEQLTQEDQEAILDEREEPLEFIEKQPSPSVIHKKEKRIIKEKKKKLKIKRKEILIKKKESDEKEKKKLRTKKVKEAEEKLRQEYEKKMQAFLKEIEEEEQKAVKKVLPVKEIKKGQPLPSIIHEKKLQKKKIKKN